MGAWVASTWAAVWPNLLASALWAPAAFVGHHMLIRRHVDRRSEELKQHITAAPTGVATETEAQA